MYPKKRTTFYQFWGLLWHRGALVLVLVGLYLYGGNGSNEVQYVL